MLKKVKGKNRKIMICLDCGEIINKITGCKCGTKEKGSTSGKNLVSLAATAIFSSGLINEEKSTQNDISKAA